MSAETFLGEFEVDVFDHSVYGQYTQSDWAMLFIERYGQFDGGQHKQWVLDQVVRILKGTLVDVVVAKWTNHPDEYRFRLQEPTQEYLDWVEMMRGEQDEDGYYEYDYDEGIAP